MNLVEILALSIVGTALSLLILFLKRKLDASDDTVTLLTIILALVVGGLYYFLSGTEFFVSVVGVLGAASTVWGFFIKGSGIFGSPTNR